MKILMVINSPNTWTGGAARIMHYLRQEMTRLGHRVDLVFTEDVPSPLGKGSLNGVTFPFLMLFALRRLTKTYGPYDIINIHTLEGALYIGLRKIFKKLPPCVVQSHGADELRWNLEKEEERLGLRRIGLKSKIFYYNLIIRNARYSTCNSDHVIIAARSEKEFYERAYGRNPKDVTFIPNGVAEEFFIARDYSQPPRKLLFLGGWEWRKGTRYLIEAFLKVAKEHSDITLSIVGTGDAQIKEDFPKEFLNRIRVIPRVTEDNVPLVYAQHDVFVFPSLFESMPLVIPEAMASGMPIVTTRACGMQDIVEDGVSGFLVPPRDSVALAQRVSTLLKNPQLCQRLGKAAQQKAREITWDRIAQQTLKLYEKLLPRTNATG